MNILQPMAATMVGFASVVFGLWMFCSPVYFKPGEIRFEIQLPKDSSKVPEEYGVAQEKLRLQLRHDDQGRLRRWIGGTEVSSDRELIDAIRRGRDPRWEIPVGIDALLDVSWREIIRHVGMFKSRGFRVEFVAPLEVPIRR